MAKQKAFKRKRSRRLIKEISLIFRSEIKDSLNLEPITACRAKQRLLSPKFTILLTPLKGLDAKKALGNVAGKVRGFSLPD